ncbi:hypothetical protein LTR17_024893 [Elasticomyces elasticus]|nr:hypothetical protein LTR17_024893 [Elasticomyces elasticus]
MTWNRTGVPKNWASGYETFEGLDPAEWCRRGYATVNVDARGSQFSEGGKGYALRQAHPALKAIAPWEGYTDIYRQLFRRGELAMNNNFARAYQWGVAGRHEVEDMAQMIDEYWVWKYDNVEKIHIPMYILSGMEERSRSGYEYTLPLNGTRCTISK